MLVNFANFGLLSIECDCLQFDGHSVQNLINLNKSQRSKGFLADRFIKPPTCISLVFKCDVDIVKIVLNPRVGSQKSAGFEILKVFRNRSTISIAQTVIQEGTEVVLFGRSDCSENPNVRFCTDRAADRVREIKLRIFKTSGSTVPALGALDVWGRPSPNVPEAIKNDIISTWKCICHPKTDSQKTKIVELDTTQKCSTSTINSDIAIPEEFIDPISCEIMTIPMTLPSGNIVDLSTLEKFNVAQAKLGRPQCDPFTGVSYSENLKPVVATSLKSRLDKFLLDHSEEPLIKTLPRTLGRKSNVSSGQPSTSYSATSAKRTFDTCERSKIQTIDDLLVDCLDGLPSFVDAVPSAKRSKVGCTGCSKLVSSGNDGYFFKLPCHDIVCRECLCTMKQMKDNKCNECREPFEFSAVIRHHV